jgi:hypothetical protein
VLDSEVPVLQTLTGKFSSARCPNGVGAIEIVSRSSRIAARIYVNNRKVYGVDISNFPLEVIRRIITSEHISDANRHNLLNVFKDNLSDARIVDYALENQMIPPSVLLVYLKDIFLGACDYIVSIPKAEITWRPSVTPKSTPVPEVDLDKLWNVVTKRQAEFQRMASIFTVDEGQVRNLKFKRVENADTQISQLIANIYSLATGEWTILDFARQFGISLFLATREIQYLWANGKLNVIYDNEFKLTPPKVLAEVNAVPTSSKARETAKTFLPPRPEDVKKNPSTNTSVTNMQINQVLVGQDFIQTQDTTVNLTTETLADKVIANMNRHKQSALPQQTPKPTLDDIEARLLEIRDSIDETLEELKNLRGE